MRVKRYAPPRIPRPCKNQEKNLIFAAMAELADAHGSGPCESNLMEVQVLLAAPDYDVVYGYRIAARNYRTPL